MFLGQVMLRNLCALVFVCTATAGSAQPEGEHLEPEPSVFTGIWGFDYYTKVLSAFGRAPMGKIEVWPGGRAAVVVIPSFEPEYGVAVTAQDGAYSVSYVRPKISIWYFLRTREQKAYVEANPENPSPEIQSDEDWAQSKKKLAEMESKLPRSVEDIQIETCVRDIDQSLAARIFQIWDTMLNQTRYAEDNFGWTDGTTYHFTMHSERHVLGMSGWVWSPPEESKTGRLVAITELLRRYCLEGSKNLRRKLAQQVDALSKRLKD